ncbi:phosphatidylserine decarboxylase family protein [Prevotella brunnea]|uniref:Phosphatidylserine decarboxylase proenzyme n=1 Tax=Prevotella brunnea TaxID=2508867 RepID=A0A5C8GLA2_9BACT|nr:phosphatidylserine decarboxylase family protein [Prevotella brunnea]TXJ62885.1 phosphatidylserine decarboxylase family protein [Prevotella brunnea]
MGKIKRKLKKVRIHHEGTDQILYGGIGVVLVALLLWFGVDSKIPFWIFSVVFVTIYCVVLNFYRCPIRYFPNEDTDKVVVAPADGHIVVIEEVEENKYFHEKRLMISIFMSLWNVHANWFPVDGVVKFVKHFNGNFHKAWLPKASEENEHADIMLKTPDGHEVLCRQIAGAVARRIVTYAKEGEDCYIDEHLGFIKLGSRVDVFLPIGSEVCVKMGQSITGNLTVLAKLP